MTEKPRAADPDSNGSAPGGSAPADSAKSQGGRRIVIRDKRKIDTSGGRGGPVPTGAAEPAADEPDDRTGRSDEPAGRDPVSPAGEDPAEKAAESAAVLDDLVEDAEVE